MKDVKFEINRSFWSSNTKFLNQNLSLFIVICAIMRIRNL